MAMGGTTETGDSLARTARNYDRLPYESRAFAASQPSRIGGIARAFGLEAAPLATARVLELGCASGGNIIPHALRYPDARFVGIDLSSAQVEAGRTRIARLGLDNIDIRCESLTAIGGELGVFDYIICHGVYSWVPAAVRDAIFRVIEERLSPIGIACVSYNVLPGWRMIQPVHDAFRLDAQGDPDLPDRVARARELLDFLAAATPDRGPYGDVLRGRAAAMAGLPDDYVAHEFLEEMSHPTTVRAFAAEAARDGLCYLADCDLGLSTLDNYGPDIAQQVRARVKDDPVEVEQYLDLLTGRTFRQSILVSAGRLAGASRSGGRECIAPLHFLTDAGLQLLWNGSEPVLVDAGGRLLPLGSTAVADGIARLIGQYPSSSSLAACAPAGQAPLVEALHRMVLAGMASLSSEPLHAGRADDRDRPIAIAIARADSVEGAGSTTNFRHEPVTLQAMSRLLLSALDGSRNRAALAELLTQEVVAGRVAFTRDGVAVTDIAAIREMAAERVSALLVGFANAGLLEA